MSFSAANYNKVREDFSYRRERAVAESENRKFAVYAQIPEMQEIDRRISSVGVRLFGASIKGENVDEAIAQMKAENQALRAKRAKLLIAHGYPADYTDIHYQCEKCLDTGFCGVKICSCMRRELIMAGYESSGLANLLETQTFETFDLSYYQGADKEKMQEIVDVLRSYAENFAEKSTINYILVGKTGLGKTHLSTAVAKVVIESGFDVVYVTAQDMFSVMENVHFHNADNTEEEHYKTCDLLIIDDFGTELTNNFIIGGFYNLINSRINSKRATMLNTNFEGTELRKRYEDRVTSRLFGEFAPLVFVGTDVRRQKYSQTKK